MTNNPRGHPLTLTAVQLVENLLDKLVPTYDRFEVGHFRQRGKMRNWDRTAFHLLLLAGFSLQGCADLTPLENGQPDTKLPRLLLGSVGATAPDSARSFPDHLFNPSPLSPDTAALPSYCLNSPAAPPPNGQQTPTNCYWAVKSLIDYEYQYYKTDLLHAVNGGNFLGDFTALGLNTAGAITPGAAAAKLFNVLAGSVTGTKALVNEDILYKQAATVVIAEMDTDRSVVQKANLLDMTTGYSYPMAINDLLAYYEAGTFQHALTSLQNKAGQDSSKPPASTPAPPKPLTKADLGTKPGASFTTSSGTDFVVTGINNDQYTVQISNRGTPSSSPQTLTYDSTNLLKLLTNLSATKSP